MLRSMGKLTIIIAITAGLACSDAKKSAENDTPTDSEGIDGGDAEDTDVDEGRPVNEAIAEMKIGWSAGNSLDVPDGETAWGNPKVTAELIQNVADKGFGVVRIPVTWAPHFGEGPSYTIDPDWLNRVEEVVGYVLDAGMYAIINTQHDGTEGFQGVEWITLTGDTEEVIAQFSKVWSQIADHFRDVDTRVIFESMNEIHDGYAEPDAEHYTTINALNQAFVDAVRGEKGDNTNRLLMVPGYFAKIDYTVAGFEAPVDTVPDRLILSVHYYDPPDFTWAGTTHTWGAESPESDDWGQEDDVLSHFDQLETTFIENNLPVIISEYAAVNQYEYETYRRYYLEFVTKAAHDRGMVPIYFDNGNMGSGQDAFGLIDRTSGEPGDPDVLDAMMRAVNDTYAIEDIASPDPGERDTETDTDTESDEIDTDASGLIAWTDGDGNDFGLYLPDGWYGSDVPVVMFLHGYTGNPISSLPWIVSALNAIEPCAVFLPHRPSAEGASAWGGTYDDGLRPAMVTTLDELERIVEAYGFDETRQYLYGESMGGEGVFMLLATYPERFAGAVAVAGYTVLEGADNMAQTPLWIIHSDADEISPVANAQDIYQAILNAGGGEVIYTEYEGLSHNASISNASSEPGLTSWLLEQRME